MLTLMEILLQLFSLQNISIHFAHVNKLHRYPNIQCVNKKKMKNLFNKM